jgi:hypothetical protein
LIYHESLVERLVLIYLLLSSRAVPGYIKRFRLILWAHMAANLRLISRMAARCSPAHAGAWRCCPAIYPALPKMAIFLRHPVLDSIRTKLSNSRKKSYCHIHNACTPVKAMQTVPRNAGFGVDLVGSIILCLCYASLLSSAFCFPPGSFASGLLTRS